MNIAHYQSNNHMGREGWKPDMITCHICEGTYHGSIEWLCNYRSGVSAHFVVSKSGQVAQLVDMRRAAWANGTYVSKSKPAYYGNSKLATVRNRKTNANLYTISIEFEGFYAKTKGDLTPQQLEAGVELIKYIKNWVKRTYGINIPFDRQHIVGHCDVAPISKPNCPGQKFPWDKLIRELNGQGEATNPKDEGDEEEMVVYETFDDIPSWGQPTIKALIDKGYLSGSGKNSKGKDIYNISQDQLRTFVVLGRTGLFDASLKRYNKVSELPEWAQGPVQNLVNQKVIADGNALNMTEDMVRTLIMVSRM